MSERYTGAEFIERVLTVAANDPRLEQVDAAVTEALSGSSNAVAFSIVVDALAQLIAAVPVDHADDFEALVDDLSPVLKDMVARLVAREPAAAGLAGRAVN